MFSIRGFRENGTKSEFEKGVGNFLAPQGVLSHCRTKTMKMNVKKTLLAAAVATAMMVPMTGAMAATVDTHNTKLKYEVAQSYEWTVPSEIDFGSNKGVGATSEVEKNINVTKNIIPDGKKLSIKIQAGQAFEIANGNTKLSYTVKKGDSELAAGAEVLSVAAGTDKGSQALTFTLSTTNGTAEVAGSYEGTLTFVTTIE